MTFEAASGNGQGGGSLAVLPAGELPTTPQRTLTRPGMGSALQTARSLADVVLIDTAPIGTVNDAVTLSRLVDGVVLVARLNRTTKDVARRALRVLRNVDVDIPGVVVIETAVRETYHYYSPVSPAVEAPPAVESREG